MFLQIIRIREEMKCNLRHVNSETITAFIFWTMPFSPLQITVIEFLKKHKISYHNLFKNYKNKFLMENNMEVIQKTKYRTTISSSNPTPGHISGQNFHSKRYLHLYVHCSIIHNSQDMETT